MKVIVTAGSPSWEAVLDPRFGRAASFVLIDTGTRELTALDTQQARGAAQGAGVLAAAAACRAGARAVIAGHCGPKAFATLSAGGVRVYTGAEGTVAEAIEGNRRAVSALVVDRS